MIKFLVGLLTGILITGIICLGGLLYWQQWSKPSNNPTGAQLPSTQKEKPLLKFSFPELAETKFEASEVVVGEKQAEGESWTSYEIMYTWEGRKISGQLTKPDEEKFPGKRPVIVMVRGFVPVEKYETGVGTRNAARKFAQSGFLTVSTDFLGYGASDKPENDIWWERFSKPSQVLQLIKSLETLPEADIEKIGMWGHSNGGQITLSVLEITGKNYPTALWAPVSVSFPYGILVFTEGTDDDGQALRRKLANFEWDYDARTFSISSYFNRITSSISLHQGTADTEVPQVWSDNLNKKLKDLNKDIAYHVYLGADHNLQPAWNTVVERDIAFYKEKFGIED